MNEDMILTHLENLDRGLARVEQILPTLATKEALENLDRRLARVEQILPTLATKEELRTAIADAIAPLATTEEMREEGARSRRHMTMLIEHQNSKIELLAEHVLASMRKPSEE